MTDTIILAVAVSLVTAMICLTALTAWRGWLDVRRLEIGRAPEAPDETGVRIELASVRERLKKLEAIASGVEL